MVRIGPPHKNRETRGRKIFFLFFSGLKAGFLFCAKKKMVNDRKDKGRIKIEAKSILGDDRKDRRGYFSYS